MTSEAIQLFFLISLYEFTPVIVWQEPTDKPVTSKINNRVFDPGPIFRFKQGFNIVARLAFADWIYFY
jgi:hypothetical protein